MQDASDRTESDPDLPEDVIPIEQCFLIRVGGQLRANENGRQRFGDRFRRAGFDIDKIRTFDELDAALRGSWHIVMEDMEQFLERRRTERRRERLRTSGLRVVAASESSS